MRFLLIFTSILLVAACSTSDPEVQVEESPDILYGQAKAALDEGSYKEATRLFDEVERQHPYSEYATQAQLMAAYASYVDQRYDEAVFALDRFIELHPGNKDIDYAYYLRALSFYERISDVRRDQAMTQLALEALQTVIRRFPDSKYGRDAQLKLDLTMDHLAGKEMEIGRYYLKRGQVNAAINRFSEVIKKYQTTTHAAEALHRLVEGYLSLGIRPEATRIAAVLGHNYPGSVWYERSYQLLSQAERGQIEDNRNWLNRTVDALLSPDEKEEEIVEIVDEVESSKTPSEE